MELLYFLILVSQHIECYNTRKSSTDEFTENSFQEKTMNLIEILSQCNSYSEQDIFLIQ